MGSTTFSFCIAAWAGWMPGLDTVDAWEAWAQGERESEDDAPVGVGFLPRRMRRRLSTFNKSTLVSLYRLERELRQVRSVFASRHGDMKTAVALFEQLAWGESVSPVLFTRSVFNNNQGLFSIAEGNAQPGTAVSGRRATFCYALLDAALQLRRAPQEAVLVSMSDEPLPAPFCAYDAEPTPGYSLSLLLTSNEGLPIEGRFVPTKAGETTPEPAGLSFVRALLRGATAWSFVGPRLTWSWETVVS